MVIFGHRKAVIVGVVILALGATAYFGRNTTAFTYAAAECGYAEAQYNLGDYYAISKKDQVEAVKWYRKAAEQGNAKAQFTLGLCYDNGNGVEKDHNEAAKWFRKAAEQGLVPIEVHSGSLIQTRQGPAAPPPTTLP